MDGGYQGLGLGGGGGQAVFKEGRVSVWKDEKILEMDGGDDHTTV